MFTATMNEESETVLARLHAAVDEMNTLSLDSCTDEQVLALWRELETARRRMAAVDHRLINEAGTRHLESATGAKTLPSLAKHLLRIGGDEARARVKAAEALGPRRALTGEALAPIYDKAAHAVAAGQISDRAAMVVVDTIEKLPDAVRAVEDANVEASLVELAQSLHLDHLRCAAKHAADLLDPDGRYKDEKYRERTRHLDLHRRADGSGHLDGDVTAELAEWLQTVFDAYAAPKPESDGAKDPRTAGQRRHDGLLDALKLLARAEQFPTCGGVTTTVLLIMTDRTYASGEGTATTGHGATVSGPTARRWANGQSRIMPVKLSALKAAEAWGHTNRLFTEGQRLAMIARDKGCSFPGCDAPPAWTEAHHVIEYSAGGRTCVTNGALLCGWHHAHFEQLGFTCTMIDGVPHWIPPWGGPPQRNHAHGPAA